MARISFETVTPLDLVVGDVYVTHCGFFRVREHREKDGVGINISDFIGETEPGACSIPASWRAGWNEQGNKWARVARVLPLPLSRVYVNDVLYVWAHGKAPRGRGMWAFAFGRSNAAPEFIGGSTCYAAAKRAAIELAAVRGVEEVWVCS